MAYTSERHAGQAVGEVLARQGVRFLYTLCGGHISPILIGAQDHGLRVVDVRHEATAVFAADATARLTGVAGVAAVTAGPGLTNTVTALKNAAMAQSPVVLLGGAAPTLLKGRGALQDIDQQALVRPLVKQAWAVRRVRDIVPALEAAFRVAQEGVPGPVFVELPVDLLYPETQVRAMMDGAAGGKTLAAHAMRLYLSAYTRRLFARGWKQRPRFPIPSVSPMPERKEVERAAALLRRAERPVLLVGSQAMLEPRQASALAGAILRLGVPTFLSGMARGLLSGDPLHLLHARGRALKEADLVILAGVPNDFRLNYGRAIPRGATLISVNRSAEDLMRNRKPTLGIQADAGLFLRALAARWEQPSERWRDWHAQGRARDAAREADICARAAEPTEWVNPVALCLALNEALDPDSVLVGDGGDFVATAAYTVRPRGPLRWLDPGAFGTLGVGAGFALAAQLVYPDAEVWLLYGDGSAGYSLAEFDTFARHRLPVIAVIGNDGSWAQIAREQVELLGSSLGTELARTAYHRAAEGFGAHGILVERLEQVPAALAEAKACARAGRPVCLNVQIGRTEFRKGSISM